MCFIKVMGFIGDTRWISRDDGGLRPLVTRKMREGSK